MKQSLRKIFSPLLNHLETGDEAYSYKPSLRWLLVFISSVFTSMGVAVFFVARGEDLGYLFPVLIFGGLGLMGLIVAMVGEDRAVAKIFGSR